jgi:hypothetical protein
MEATTHTIRQFLGCGYEPQIERAQPWVPQGFDGKAEHCAGYTSRLPQVIEVARAFLHWEKGQLQLRHDDPPAALLDGIEALSGSVAACQSHGLKEASKRRG